MRFICQWYEGYTFYLILKLIYLMEIMNQTEIMMHSTEITMGFFPQNHDGILSKHDCTLLSNYDGTLLSNHDGILPRSPPGLPKARGVQP